MSLRRLLIALVLLSALAGRPVPAAAADWPTWRHDAGRTAVTAEALAPQLSLQWVQHRPAITPAWPDDPFMTFDTAYEPVVMGGRAFLGSPMEDTVTALDVASGKELWRYTTDGPVRFAPAAWQDKVYAASDDGCLYCLDAATGALRWRYRGAPTERLVLGNGRLISSWPARGGPVIVDGTVYGSAGIWPFMGVFLYALDAETGAVKWRNDGCGALYQLQPHDSPAFAGIAPQGYLVAAGDRLLVPNGRSVPACFDRLSGAFQYYRLAKYGKIGTTQVAAAGDYFINDANLFLQATGERVVDAPEQPVLDRDAVYGTHRGTLTAYETRHLAQLAEAVKAPAAGGAAATKAEPAPVWPEAWRLKGVDRVFLKAGGRLYGASGSKVVAIDLPAAGAAPQISWSAAVEGTPASMAAAAGRLFVGTREGALYCFGADPAAPAAQPRRPAAASSEDAFTRQAREILARTGVTDGYALVWGIGSPRLLEELARQSRLQIIGIDPDAAKVAAARRALSAAGLYGARVALLAADPVQCPLPAYMAGLVVVADPAAAGLDRGRAFVERLFRPIRPYGGVAYLPIAAAEQARLGQWVQEAKLAGAELSRGDGFALLKRNGPLAGAGDWTHQYGDAANTTVSRDTLVRAPLGLLWFGGSSHNGILPRHGHGPAPQVIGGRLFIEGPDLLRAVDVYTGRVLWETPMPGLGAAFDITSHQPGANATGSNYACAEDGIYVAWGKRCLRLDPATGKTLSEFGLPAMPGAATPAWGWLAVWQDLLVAAADPIIFDRRSIGSLSWNGTASRRLVVMDRHTGKVLWTRDAAFGIRHNAIAIAAGKLFCVDMLPATQLGLLKRTPAPEAVPELLALDARTGRVLWSVKEKVFGTWLGYSEAHDVLLQAGRASRDMLDGEPKERLTAYRGADGSVLWEHQGTYGGPCLIHGDTIITQGLQGGLTNIRGAALSLLTGRPVSRKNPITGEEMEWSFTRNYGCNTAIACQNLLTFRSAAAGFCDWEGDGGTGNLGGFKSGCTSNLIAADGVLSAPDYTRTCVCRYQNQTSLALVSDPDVEMWTFNAFPLGRGAVRQVGLNFGAPGDRRAPDGTLWLDCPSVGGPSPDVPVTLTPAAPAAFRLSPLRIAGGIPWVAASGLEGVSRVAITLVPAGEQARRYTVRLHFVEPAEKKPGERVFSVSLQGRQVIPALDVAQAAGGPYRALVREFKGVAVAKDLVVDLAPAGGAKGSAPVLSGIEVVAEER